MLSIIILLAIGLLCAFLFTILITSVADEANKICKDIAKQFSEDEKLMPTCYISTSFDKILNLFLSNPRKVDFVIASQIEHELYFPDIVKQGTKKLSFGEKIIGVVVIRNSSAAICCCDSYSSFCKINRYFKKYNNKCLQKKNEFEQLKFCAKNSQNAVEFAKELILDSQNQESENKRKMQEAQTSINDIVNGMEDIRTVQDSLAISVQSTLSANICN